MRFGFANVLVLAFIALVVVTIVALLLGWRP